MAPNAGLVHPKEYDIKDSNVELIGSDIDHRVKYNSAATEPAWKDVGQSPGLFVWRIEDFEVVPLAKSQYGQFYDGDSYIVLYSYKVGKDENNQKLGHEIFFWLGNHTTQDEAGTAAYKTVELDEFLHGVATQHREVQRSPSKEFLALFPRISIRSGGVRSGFRHVEEETKEAILTLLRVFKNESAGANGVIVHEVEPTWKSLDDGDVFVLDTGDKIWVWQGKNCSPMEKAKAAQVVHDMTQAKHVDVEVVSQAESGSGRVIAQLGGDQDTPRQGLQQPRPIASGAKPHSPDEHKKLFRLSDASGELSFDLVKDGGHLSMSDLDGNDVFLLDDDGQAIWVWEGQGASRAERSQWLQVARAYINHIQSAQEDAFLIPLAKVSEGNESRAFIKAIEA
jgi:gelsolin